MAWQTHTNSPVPVAYIQLIQPLSQPRFPDRTKEALEAADYRQEQARIAQEAAAAAQSAAQQAQEAYTAPTQPTNPTYANNYDYLLVGTLGYALPGGNCVDEVPIALQFPGNPISWPVLTPIPYIGAVALFPYNHVAMVVGLWGNGDVEVDQQNWAGAPITRFPLSAFRGFR